MLSLEQAIDEVRLKLGATKEMKMKLEMNTSDITSVIESSLRELTTYMDTPMVSIVPFNDVIDITKYKIASLVHVMRSESPVGVAQVVSLDPFYLSGSTGVVSGNSASINTHSILQTQIQYAVRSLYQNTVQDDLNFFVDYYTKKLYVSYSGMRPSYLTLFYKPVINSIEDLVSDYWVNYLIRLAVAHSKIIIGTIRKKYSVPNSPFSVDGDSFLEQGTSEYEAIRSELKSTRHATFD